MRKGIDADIRTIRDKTINQAFVAISIIGVVGWCFVIGRALVFEFNISFYIQQFFVIFLWTVTLLRKKLPIKFKVNALIIIGFFFVTSGLYNYGFLASGKLYITLVPVFISFIVPYRTAILALLFFVFVYLVFGALYISGIFNYSIAPSEYTSSPVSWILESIIILLASWGLLYVGDNFSSSILERNKTIKEQHKKLLNEEKKYRVLFESSNDAIIIARNKKVFICNDKALELFKCDREQIFGCTPLDLSPKTQPDGKKTIDEIKTHFKEVELGKPIIFDWQHKRFNGELFEVSVSLNQIEFDNEIFVLSVMRDITEKKQIERELVSHRYKLEYMVKKRTNELEKTNEELKQTMAALRETQSQLIQSEKMASLGVLTAGVAHEINNPLNFIQSGVFGLENLFKHGVMQCSEPEKQKLVLDTIKSGVKRASNIIKTLDMMGQGEKEAFTYIDIHQIIDNCIVVLNHQIGKMHSLSKDYTKKSFKLKGNNRNLHQVFINLLMNSIQSINGGGAIGIITKLTDNNEKLNIKIKDNGEGIAPENLKYIFDPFFTTKSPGQGTGLGLYLVYNIIKEHKGEIRINSVLHGGTEVFVELPVSQLDVLPGALG